MNILAQKYGPCRVVGWAWEPSECTVSEVANLELVWVPNADLPVAVFAVSTIQVMLQEFIPYYVVVDETRAIRVESTHPGKAHIFTDYMALREFREMWMPMEY